MITKEMVQAAYATTGLLPVVGVWTWVAKTGERYADPLAVLVMAKHWSKGADVFDRFAAAPDRGKHPRSGAANGRIELACQAAGETAPYIDGFAAGLDGVRSGTEDRQPPEWVRGFHDARALGLNASTPEDIV